MVKSDFPIRPVPGQVVVVEVRRSIFISLLVVLIFRVFFLFAFFDCSIDLTRQLATNVSTGIITGILNGTVPLQTGNFAYALNSIQLCYYEEFFFF